MNCFTAEKTSTTCQQQHMLHFLGKLSLLIYNKSFFFFFLLIHDATNNNVKLIIMGIIISRPVVSDHFFLFLDLTKTFSLVLLLWVKNCIFINIKPIPEDLKSLCSSIKRGERNIIFIYTISSMFFKHLNYNTIWTGRADILHLITMNHFVLLENSRLLFCIYVHQ